MCCEHPTKRGHCPCLLFPQDAFKYLEFEFLLLISDLMREESLLKKEG